MRPSPNVSVIITAYNAARWIGDTLDSVLQQTYDDFELIVVDDGSTDETAAVVQRYGSSIRYLHQENRGQPAARNVGIREAEGTYVAFVDADDLWLPDKLARQMGLFDQEPDLAWVYADAYLFDSASGEVLQTASQGQTQYEGDILRPLLMGNFIPSPTPVVRRSVFDEVGYFGEADHLRGGGGEDWDMWLRIAARYPVRVIRQPLARIRIHRASMTQSMDIETALRGRIAVVQAAVHRNPERIEEVQHRAFSNQHITAGRWALARGERRQARQYFWQALRSDPLNVRAWMYYGVALVPPFMRKALGMLRFQWRGWRMPRRIASENE